MKIRHQTGWWHNDNSFVCVPEKAAEIVTTDECKKIIRRLLEIPHIEPRDLHIEINGKEQFTADKWYRKVPRWQLLRELPIKNLGGKCKNLKRAKTLLDQGKTIYVNGCEIWNNGQYYCWINYGSSACRRNLNELRFVFHTIAKSEDYSFSIIPTNLGNWEIREVA